LFSSLRRRSSSAFFFQLSSCDVIKRGYRLPLGFLPDLLVVAEHRRSWQTPRPRTREHSSTLGGRHGILVSWPILSTLLAVTPENPLQRNEDQSTTASVRLEERSAGLGNEESALCQTRHSLPK
jgi:hypothetical protein